MFIKINLNFSVKKSRVGNVYLENGNMSLVKGNMFCVNGKLFLVNGKPFINKSHASCRFLKYAWCI